MKKENPVLKKAISWLLSLQDTRTGSWHGEIWETSFVLSALGDSGLKREFDPIDRGVSWLLSCQLSDGSWLHAPHPTAIATLSLENLNYPQPDRIKDALNWLLEYGMENVWTQECYANSYALIALVKAGVSLDSKAIQNCLHWLVQSQTKTGVDLGYWCDEEDTSLAIIAVALALKLSFGERRVIMQPVLTDCVISGTNNLINWQVSIPSLPKIGCFVQVDSGYLRKVAEDTNRFGGGINRSLRYRPTNQTIDESIQVEDLKEIGRQIWNLFIPKEFRKVLREQRIDHLLIELSGDAAVAGVPWEIAYDDASQSFLCLRFAIGRKILQSRFTHIDVINPRPERKPKILLVASPMNDLPNTTVEVQKIAEELESRSLADCVLLEETRLGLSKSGFVREIVRGDYDVIHYAGHAVVDITNPDTSYLPILEKDNSISKLFAYEISNATSNRPPQIVFLNACSSASDRIDGIVEEASGLASAFISKNIPAFVGPLWKVQDHDASDLAIRFYENMAIGFTIGESLRIAREECLSHGAGALVSWASFILHGDPSMKLFN